MLLAFCGVTGIGKSYYKDLLIDKLGFEKIKIITTRSIRKGEKNNEDKVFVTENELDNLRINGKIAYEFNLLGNTYAYTKEELFSNKNTVFELHYETIHDFKRICSHLKTIYLFPEDLEDPINKMKNRGLSKIVEEDRLNEIKKHYSTMINDDNLRNMFDYFVINHYNSDTEKEIIEILKREGINE